MAFYFYFLMFLNCFCLFCSAPFYFPQVFAVLRLAKQFPVSFPGASQEPLESLSEEPIASLRGSALEPHTLIASESQIFRISFAFVS